MGTKQDDAGDRHVSPLDLWRLALACVAVIAIVMELRKPPDQRTWHGKVAGVVPYDFRRPSPSRIRDAVWNPEGPIVSGKVWGAGWTINLGAVKARLKPRP
jgi:hypothetical protein